MIVRILCIDIKPNVEHINSNLAKRPVILSLKELNWQWQTRLIRNEEKKYNDVQRICLVSAKQGRTHCRIIRKRLGSGYNPRTVRKTLRKEMRNRQSEGQWSTERMKMSSELRANEAHRTDCRESKRKRERR